MTIYLYIKGIMIMNSIIIAYLLHDKTSQKQILILINCKLFITYSHNKLEEIN